jgi:hypothetical protein
MSTRLAFLGLTLLATMLAGVIVLELDADDAQGDSTGIVAIRHAPLAKARAAVEDPVDRTDAWVETSLARPLFSRDRRPTAVVTSSGGGTVVTSMPRLTGVLVTPLGRSAIFAGTDGGKPLIASAGTALGPYVVQAIEPGRVTVAGPQGVLQLQPSYDANARRAALAEAQPQPPQPAFALRPGAQFQRALSAIQPFRPPQPRDENNQ